MNEPPVILTTVVFTFHALPSLLNEITRSMQKARPISLQGVRQSLFKELTLNIGRIRKKSNSFLP